MKNDYYQLTGFWGVIIPISNIVLAAIGTLIFALGAVICSIIEWLLTNIAAIAAGIGGLIFFIIFLGYTYSYFQDVKTINKSFDSQTKKANELIKSLRKKVLISTGKVLIFMLIYGILWGIAIAFINVFFGI